MTTPTEEIPPVNVHVKNWKPTHRLSTRIKTWSIDGTAASGDPAVQQIAGYDVNRESLEIRIGDATAFIVTQENPGTLAATDTAGASVSGKAIHFPANTAAAPLRIYGPDPVWIVAISGNAVMRIGVVIHNRVRDDD
jgi:hypothetical protein